MNTRCHLEHLNGCRQPGHVVLYAAGISLAGQPTAERQQLHFCLKHGGIIYDINRAIRTTGRAELPDWLAADRNRLPRNTPDPGGWVTAATHTPRNWKAADFRNTQGRR